MQSMVAIHALGAKPCPDIADFWTPDFLEYFLSLHMGGDARLLRPA